MRLSVLISGGEGLGFWPKPIARLCGVMVSVSYIDTLAVLAAHLEQNPIRLHRSLRR
jgi:hypothetical protein